MRGDALDRHMRNKGADWWQTRNAAADDAAWERSRALQAEALRLARQHKKPVAAREPAPETNYTPEPGARWTGATAIRAPCTPGGINHARNRN